ncbi:MAG: DUF4395 domain-containing protein [Candidatus Absconditabacterales bacterium]|nr:DUF4395 domain-containing protein [Candidatus Absconditabacterales bacterium]
MHYGYRIPGLVIDGEEIFYDVLNERSIRSGAGVMFVIGFGTMMYTFLTKDFSVLMIVLPLIFGEFVIRVFISPRFAPLACLGDLLVKNQKPDYVGAVQKRFAWGLGLVMASIMMILVFVVGYQGPRLLAICGTCLLFMRLETSVGLCVGCKIYYRLREKNILPDPGYRPVCAGGVCSIKRPVTK